MDGGGLWDGHGDEFEIDMKLDLKLDMKLDMHCLSPYNQIARTPINLILNQ